MSLLGDRRLPLTLMLRAQPGEDAAPKLLRDRGLLVLLMHGPSPTWTLAPGSALNLPLLFQELALLRKSGRLRLCARVALLRVEQVLLEARDTPPSDFGRQCLEGDAGEIPGRWSSNAGGVTSSAGGTTIGSGTLSV
mmetsp:Transcript_86329/g.244723  ORF Transcript_86329/g.244723 Transcript_86329/m.244723 type:complete len:137 (-) Transcript_86329:1308-1718(-)